MSTSWLTVGRRKVIAERCFDMTDQPGSSELDAEPVWHYPDVIPAELTARWVRLPADTLVVIDLFRFLCEAAALVTAVAAGAVWVYSTPTALILTVMAVAGALLSAGLRRWSTRRYEITPAQIDIVLEHRRQLDIPNPVDQDFSGVHSELVGVDEMEPANPEWRLADHAAATVAAIICSAAWVDDHDHDRLALDPVEQLRQIRVSAWHLAELRRRIGPEPTTDATSGHRALREWQILADQLTEGVAALHGRVKALDVIQVAIDRRVVASDRRRVLEDLLDTSEDLALTISRQTAHQNLAAAELLLIGENISRLRVEEHPA